ncbi:unnamed protein product [Symbiodinium sp. CCMP2592]|nr:unnamed protein product [Symbiodinium sp. CCMP2592]
MTAWLAGDQPSCLDRTGTDAMDFSVAWTLAMLSANLMNNQGQIRGSTRGSMFVDPSLSSTHLVPRSTCTEVAPRLWISPPIAIDSRETCDHCKKGGYGGHGSYCLSAEPSCLWLVPSFEEGCLLEVGLVEIPRRCSHARRHAHSPEAQSMTVCSRESAKISQW